MFCRSHFVDPVATFLDEEILVCGGGGRADANDTDITPLGTCKGIKIYKKWKSKAGMTQARSVTKVGPP